MTEPINIPINIRAGDLSGLLAIQRAVEKMSTHVEGGGFAPSYRTISQRLGYVIRQSGEETGAAVRQMVSTIRAAVHGLEGSVGPTLTAINQQLRTTLGLDDYVGTGGRYGGSRRVTYTPAPPSPRIAPLPPPLGYTDVRPGGIRPWPAGIPASPFGPAAGGPGGQTPLQQLVAQISPTPGRLQQAHALLQAQRQQAAQAGLAQVQTASIYAQMLGQPSLQTAWAMQFQTPVPLGGVQQAHATMMMQQAATNQAGLQNAQRIALVAQMASPWQRTWGNVQQAWAAGGPGGGPLLGAMIGGGGLSAVGGAIGGALGSAGGIGGTIAGSAIGSYIGSLPGRAAHMMMASITGRENREVSLLQLGDTLNQRFGLLRQTMVAMRRDFQVLGQEGVQAMQHLAMATGLEEDALTRATYAAVGAGRYYGLGATESVGLLTALRMAGDPTADLRGVMAVGREAAARHPGTLSVARFAQETAQAAMVGGLGFAPMSGDMLARQVQFMQEMGGRYATNPGMAVLERATQMGQPQTTVGQVIAVTALDRLRQRQRFVTLGQGPNAMQLDLNDPEDMRIARENIFQIPEARESLRQEVQLQAPGNPALQRLYYGQATSAPTAYQARLEWEGQQSVAQQYGSIPAYLNRPADIAGQINWEATRKALETGELGLDVLKTRAVPEEISETLPLRTLEQVRKSVLEAMGAVAESMNKGEASMASFFQSIVDGTLTMGKFFDFIERRLPAEGGLFAPGSQPTMPGPTQPDLIDRLWGSLFHAAPLLPDPGAMGPRRAFSR
jgi:hypothetical protein